MTTPRPTLKNSFVRRNVDQIDYHLRNSATDLTLSKPKRKFLRRGFKYSGAMLWNPEDYYNYLRRSFAAFAPKLWNQLPLALRQSDSVDSFKMAMKTYLFRESSFFF